MASNRSRIGGQSVAPQAAAPLPGVSRLRAAAIATISKKCSVQAFASLLASDGSKKEEGGAA